MQRQKRGQGQDFAGNSLCSILCFKCKKYDKMARKGKIKTSYNENLLSFIWKGKKFLELRRRLRQYSGLGQKRTDSQGNTYRTGVDTVHVLPTSLRKRGGRAFLGGGVFSYRSLASSSSVYK